MRLKWLLALLLVSMYYPMELKANDLSDRFAQHRSALWNLYKLISDAKENNKKITPEEICDRFGLLYKQNLENATRTYTEVMTAKTEGKELERHLPEKMTNHLQAYQELATDRYPCLSRFLTNP